MSEENRALQRQLQQKHEKELEKLQAAVSTLHIFAFYNAGYEAMHVVGRTFHEICICICKYNYDLPHRKCSV